MNIVTKYALAGASLVAAYAYACANPVDIEEDVIKVDPNTFGDGGVPLGGAAGVGGSGGDTSQAGTGGGTSGTGGGAGTSSGGGSGGGPGAGGTDAGSGGSGGAAGSDAGSGGAAQGGTGGGAGAAGSAGSAGTGNTGEFNAANCNFADPTGCEDLDCESACPAGGGNYCPDACNALLTCVDTDTACTVTEEDPLCAERDGGTPNACTAEADSAGGANSTQPTSPAFIAREYVNCMCTRAP